MNKNVKGDMLLISEWLVNHFVVSFGEFDDSKIYLGHFVLDKKKESELKNYCNSILNILVSIYLNKNVMLLSSSELEIKNFFLKYLDNTHYDKDILLNDSLSILTGLLFNGKSEEFIDKNYNDIVKKMSLLGMERVDVLEDRNYCHIFCNIMNDNRNSLKRSSCYSLDYMFLKTAYDDGLFYYSVVGEFKNFVISSGFKSLELVKNIYYNSSFVYGDFLISTLEKKKK